MEIVKEKAQNKLANYSFGSGTLVPHKSGYITVKCGKYYLSEVCHFDQREKSLYTQ